jgi:hypothetical protein
MASKDFASAVISARRSDEMSHMTVFMVVLLQSSSGGIATRPSGIGISESFGAI